jgi:nucleoredoxin
MLGDTLRTKDGKTVTTTDALKGKVIGLYFSAHWCPPCRGFTPKLAEAYKTYQEKGLPFEIVFVSSDKDEKAFNEYHGEMPWLALPFAERDLKATLSKRFKVRGIPTLVILDADGSIITTDGREAVTEDPKGDAFPWKPKPLSATLGGDLVLDGKDGAKVAIAELASKHLLLYFSAHWCPPCRGFTPKLAEHYAAWKAKGLDFECVFVSSDRDEKSFGEYHGEMPWLALPFADRERKGALSKAFDVSGIPSLVVLGPVDEATGERPVINKNARGAAGADAAGADFPWAPKPLEDLATTAECNGSDINESPALVALLEGCDDKVQAAAKAALGEVAAEIAAAGKTSADGPAAICFFACEGKGVVPRVRQLCSLPAPADKPTLMLLDIPDDGGFYVSAETELSADAIRGFLASYSSGALKGERQQLKG